MKTLAAFLVVLCTTIALAQEPTFRWELPSPAEAAKITAETFPGTDAVIIVKEQGFTEGPHTKSLFAITNEVTVTSRAMVVKLLNEKAVEKFGSFSYEYPDMREKVERHVFTVKARVMKPDGTIHVLPDTAIKHVSGISTGRGHSLTQKVMYKIPDLAPGDIVQYEYAHAEPFSFKRQVLFFYHDRYPVLTSVVYVNMTKKEEVRYLHFPPDQFGPADVKDLGKAISSLWTLKNLAAVPDEPFGRPLSDVSYLTTIVKPSDEKDGDAWRPVARDYYRDNVEQGSVPKSFMRDIGLDPSLENPDWTTIDTLYTALRKYFRLKESSSLYTDFRLVDKQIENKECDASDMAFIMLKALDRWGVHATPVLLRDRREGEYELTVASPVWFDRMGLLVSYKEKDVIFDFDRCIPSRYETPWFINPAVMFAAQDTGGWHLRLKIASTWREHISAENHMISLNPGKKASDSVTFGLKGALAQKKRGALYAKTGDDLDKELRSYLGENALLEVDHAEINGFLDEPIIRITGNGVSRGTAATIDSFLTYQPRNHFVRNFRENFTLPARHYDISLDEPFAFSFKWRIPIPEHYEIARVPDEAQLVGPAGATAQISYLRQQDAVEVNAIVVFSSATVPLAKYADWRSYLDKVNSTMEREIAFRKKAG